jgi:hypothetical protein
MLHWDEILPVCRRLRRLVAALEEENADLRGRIQGLDHEKGVLTAAASQLAGELHALKAATWAPPGHFYSPLVDPADEVVQRRLREVECGTLPGLGDFQLDERLIRNWITRISSHYEQAPFSDVPQDGLRYSYKNTAFSYGDALALFGILLELRPQRFIEVGSGYSSCLAMDTNDRFLDGKLNITFVEPYPETLFSLLGADDPYRERVVVKRLQNVPTELFTELGPGDILFIDSSHVGKMGSDVNDYLFRILPALRPGVVVHIHDIPYPFEYGPQWIVEQNRSWNEAYLLRAFLQYNAAFRVFYFNHFVYRQFSDILTTKMPLCLKDCGASIWLEKLATPPVTGN